MRRQQFCWIGILLAMVIAMPVSADTKYEPNWESLDKRPIPDWYQDAKFGIFIHWGVYSVPAWSPKGTYAEWYWNSLRRGKTNPTDDPTKRPYVWTYHKEKYGEDFQYNDFAAKFQAELFDPEHWAHVFKNAGAKYVVLTSKHHDGFCLWPSEEANRSWGRPWNSVSTGPGRDLLGDLGKAVREAGLRMGFYYSLYEWFNPLWLTDRDVYIKEHMIPQFKDVVTNYNPSIIFSDGEWDLPADRWHSQELLAWLYNETEVKDEVVVNDRWGQNTRHHHGDYYTTEYATGMKDASHPWEENRGMGHSYGYNRNETLEDYNSSRELILMLIDLVSRGGNLLLNVGPRGDGQLPTIMEQRLNDIGDWMAINSEAIYGTRPWKKNVQWSEGKVPQVEYGGSYMVKYDINEVTGDREGENAVVEAFFTKKEENLYAILPRWPGKTFTVKDVQSSDNTNIMLLGLDRELKWKQNGDNIVITVPQNIEDDNVRFQTAYTLKLTNMQ